MQTYILPKPLFLRSFNGKFEFLNPELIIKGNDNRVNAAAERLYADFSDKTATPTGVLEITFANGKDEKYSLVINESGIKITAESAAGAFYGVQTLRQLLMQSNKLDYILIHDRPELKFRGFYHDVTRGRIPTVETLKKLVDKLSLYKINVLQLYVEHSFDFKEYKEINKDQEPLTAAEIKELSEYCRERFIDLQPSLSCFGHLYALLQSENYKHLCELEDYFPSKHLWNERMAHHTIDATNPESLKLVKSLIDQYLSVYNSDFFNICCDETFDLGKGRNSGKDSGILYIDFVSQIIKYLEGKGKTVMLWGDVILYHIDLLPKLSDKAIFLNWNYCDNVNYEQIHKITAAGKKQILCPGTSGWCRLIEYLPLANENIRRMALFAKMDSALGLLNTNWGDFGHFCNIENASHGLILGAAEAWNPGAADNDYFDRAVCILNYRCNDRTPIKVLELLNKSDEMGILTQVLNLCGTKLYSGYEFKVEQLGGEKLKNLITDCKNAENMIFKKTGEGEFESKTADSFLLAATGYKLMLQGLDIYCNHSEYPGWKNEFAVWKEKFSRAWQEENKKDELPILLKFLDDFSAIVFEETVDNR